MSSHPQVQPPSASSSQDTSASVPPSGIDRLLDANLNRATEGLRVIEDYLRFVLDDGHLASRCKRLRHELATVAARLSPPQPVLSRDARQDVGRDRKLDDELTRSSPQSVVRANFKRSQQAMRSLEEWLKLTTAGEANICENLRYQTYELESAVERIWQAQQNLDTVQLCVLIDGGHDRDDFQRRLQQLVKEGVPLIQLRDKHLPDRELWDRAELLMEQTRDTSTRVVVNDRTDIARLVRADGAHLGQDDLPVSQARRLLGPSALIGVSTHSLEQARHAVNEGASYLGVGPTFASRTKSFDRFPGTTFLRQVAREIRLPAFAIGGIDLGRLDEVLSCGIRRVAVASAIWGAADPADASRQFLRRLAAAPARSPQTSEQTIEEPST